MAGKICCWNWCCCCCCWDVLPSLLGLNELIEQIEFDWPVVVAIGLVFEPVPQLPPARKFALKSNLPMLLARAADGDWFPPKCNGSTGGWCSCCVAVAVTNKSVGRYSLNGVFVRAWITLTRTKQLTTENTLACEFFLICREENLQKFETFEDWFFCLLF